MNAYVFTTHAAAQACATPVDAACGYPCAGTNIGGGVHVVPTFVTQTYAVPIAHPTLPLWAYPADAVTMPVLGPMATALALPAATTLDATWTPVAALPSGGQTAQATA